MSSVVPVQAGETVFFVELRESDGASTAGLNPLKLEGLGDTIRAIADELQQAWAHVRPDEASVEFGLDLTAKSGKLTGLLVEGEGKASVKVTLTWTKH